MKRNFNFSNQADRMPLYNRSHGQSKSRGDGDIALSTHKKQIFLEKEVKSEDTLQSVALEFNVSKTGISQTLQFFEKITGEILGFKVYDEKIKIKKFKKTQDLLVDTKVAELKRINNIHKDNEIYARKVLKVPSNPLSLLLEKEYFKDNENLEPELPVPENFNIIVETVNNSSCAPKNSCENETEIDQGKHSYLPSQGEVQESVSLLNTKVEHRSADVISCNGADWGISWHVLILVTLVVGVGGPVLYIFWFLWGRKGKTEGS